MISMTDINDWEMSPEVVKLYEVKRNSIVSPEVAPLDLYDFSRVDGMYSFCKCMTTKEIVHLACWTPVFVWNKKLPIVTL